MADVNRTEDALRPHALQLARLPACSEESLQPSPPLHPGRDAVEAPHIPVLDPPGRAGDDGDPLEADLPALIAAAGLASTGAFDALYRAISPALIRYLRAVEPLEAEDLAADVWLAIASQLDSFAGDENGFRALVFTIARRRVVDHRRRRHRRRTDLVANDSLTGHAGSEQTEAQVIARLDAQRAVDELVRRLPPAHAEVILLRVIGGLAVDQVAEILDRSPGAVRILQHRALKRLRP